MKILMLIYSDTGNTLLVAKKIKQEMETKKNKVIIVMVPKKSINEKKVMTFNIVDYDKIIIGSPVHAFSLSSVMKDYLNQINEFKQKEIACFVTQQFSKSWLGGNRAINQIRKLVNNKNGMIIKTGVVNWSNKDREKQIERIAIDFSNI